jgi:hypothetical protein
MEAKYSSETSVDFQLTSRHYIPEYSTIHNLKLIPLTQLTQVEYGPMDCNAV